MLEEKKYGQYQIRLKNTFTFVFFGSQNKRQHVIRVAYLASSVFELSTVSEIFDLDALCKRLAELDMRFLKPTMRLVRC